MIRTEYLHQLMIERNWKCIDLANLVGVQRSYIWSIIKGKTDTISFKMAERLAWQFEIPTATFLKNLDPERWGNLNDKLPKVKGELSQQDSKLLRLHNAMPREARPYFEQFMSALMCLFEKQDREIYLLKNQVMKLTAIQDADHPS